MIFSDLYRSPRSPFSKLRVSHPHAAALPLDIDADLISKDKVRQKEAVRRFLTEKVRNDWDFVWPPILPSPLLASEDVPTSEAQAVVEIPHSAPTAPTVEDDTPRGPGEQADSESDAESVYSTVSEDQAHFRPRLEWTSDLSDDDEPPASASPFRFDSPDAVGAAVSCSSIARQTRRRRAVREEVTWNPGLACFEARRNAWTGAKTVRVKPKPPSPISPSSPRRLFWRHHRSESAASSHGGIGSGSPPSVSSPLSPTTTRTSQQTDASTPLRYRDAHPRAAPLLPAQNPMRASVTPSIYPSLYDKIVVHSLQPSCPVNLGDMIRACVVGWKRDGEWPPKPTMAAPALSAMELAAIRHQKAAAAQQQHAHARKASTATVGSSRRLSFGFLGGSKHMMSM
ncbi:hypothetical protein B0H67DRAFT_603988 [Lasiosphaeris hirsuta]|uniref:Gag1-like clamp domain-containing protein n=1 Tax=Lasiosphaeris hirsuta TaxID=260670 RepID=A0AA39ZWQ4_9PEZI|nr:hypothetical protein B0H67DRAFT_603988 [Lasiosphaeris hirsuta]